MVELLVVIGIIALLVSILLPSLQSARASAISVACLNSVRQIGTADVMYINENEGWHIPIKGSSGIIREGWVPKPNPMPSWSFYMYWSIPEVRGYLGMDPVPLDAATDPLAWQKDWDLICPEAHMAIENGNLIPYSYAWNNFWQAAGPPTYGQFNGFKAVDIPSSSEKVRLMDANYWITSYSYDLVHPDGNWESTGGALRYIIGNDISNGYRHNNKSASVLFFDGHAESMSGYELYGDGQNYKMWNPVGNRHPGTY